MNDVIIVINENGAFDKAYADSEVNVTILKRGKDDDKIDHAEAHLEEISE